MYEYGGYFLDITISLEDGATGILPELDITLFPRIHGHRYRKKSGEYIPNMDLWMFYSPLRHNEIFIMHGILQLHFINQSILSYMGLLNNELLQDQNSILDFFKRHYPQVTLPDQGFIDKNFGLVLLFGVNSIYEHYQQLASEDDNTRIRDIYSSDKVRSFFSKGSHMHYFLMYSENNSPKSFNLVKTFGMSGWKKNNYDKFCEFSKLLFLGQQVSNLLQGSRSLSDIDTEITYEELIILYNLLESDIFYVIQIIIIVILII